jgi:NADH-quinone oxidoreductase subunit M
LSGFVAEMTVFIGSFQHADTFYRVLTLIATCSIVITAVYILRTVAKILYGPVQDPHHLHLTDATWYEKISTVGLIVFIAALGMFPSGVAEMIRNSLEPIITRLM